MKFVFCKGMKRHESIYCQYFLGYLSSKIITLNNQRLYIYIYTFCIIAVTMSSFFKLKKKKNMSHVLVYIHVCIDSYLYFLAGQWFNIWSRDNICVNVYIHVHTLRRMYVGIHMILLLEFQSDNHILEHKKCIHIFHSS